jgi:hypothetical protein
MTEGTLREVMEVERDIKRMLEAESANAREWLQRQKKAVERDGRSAAAELERRRRGNRAQAAAAAEEEAARVVARARACARRFDELDEAWLTDVVWRHLVGIGPGRDA